MADSGPSVQGLASEWDGIPTVRDRLRGGRGLIEEVSCKNVDIQTPCAYSDVLLPILTRMRDAAKKLPGIDSLREQVTVLLEMNKREPEETLVQKSAWVLRKQCGFVKMKVRRMEVSIAARSKLAS